MLKKINEADFDKFDDDMFVDIYKGNSSQVELLKLTLRSITNLVADNIKMTDNIISLADRLSVVEHDVITLELQKQYLE